MNGQTIGTCSICGGAVMMPLAWWSVTPPAATCSRCGATAAQHGPVIPMQPAAPPQPSTGLPIDRFAWTDTSTAAPRWGALGAMLALLALVFVSGCGASAYGMHARAATIAAATMQATDSVLDAAHRDALTRVADAHPVHGAERNAAIDAEETKWQPVALALDSARQALITWVEAVQLAYEVDSGGGDGALLPQLAQLAARVVLLYDRVIAAAEAAGASDLPNLPDVVRALAISIGGQ